MPIELRYCNTIRLENDFKLATLTDSNKYALIDAMTLYTLSDIKRLVRSDDVGDIFEYVEKEFTVIGKDDSGKLLYIKN